MMKIKTKALLINLIIILSLISCRQIPKEITQQIPNGKLELIKQLNDSQIWDPLLHNNHLFFAQIFQDPKKDEIDGKVCEMNLSNGEILKSSPKHEGVSHIETIFSDTILATGFRGMVTYTIDSNSFQIKNWSVLEGEQVDFLTRFENQFIFQKRMGSIGVRYLLSYNDQLKLLWMYPPKEIKPIGVARTFLYSPFLIKNQLGHLLFYDKGSIYHISLDMYTGKEVIKEKILTKKDYFNPRTESKPYEEIIWGKNQTYFLETTGNQLSIIYFSWKNNHLSKDDQVTLPISDPSLLRSRFIFNGIVKQNNLFIIPIQFAKVEVVGKYVEGFRNDWVDTRLFVYDILTKKIKTQTILPIGSFAKIVVEEDKIGGESYKVFLIYTEYGGEGSGFNPPKPKVNATVERAKKIVCVNTLSGKIEWEKVLQYSRDVFFQDSKFGLTPYYETENDKSMSVMDTNGKIQFQTELTDAWNQFMIEKKIVNFFSIDLLPYDTDKVIVITNNGFVYNWTLNSP